MRRITGTRRPLAGQERVLRRITVTIENYFRDRLFYIGPLREYPKRYYLASGEKPRDVGLRGEKTVDLLHVETEDVLRRTKQWLKRFEMAKDIIVKPVTHGIWVVQIAYPKMKLK